MLTIGSPIKMNTGRPFTTIPAPSASWENAFCESIAGSYDLMAMDFTPKDMLLLMFASPEIPEFGGSFTNITEVEHSVNSRYALLNIVNNVINRILLTEGYDFSYRDEVYLSTVLRRLGITDARSFVQEAIAAVNESKTTERLTERYERDGAILRESAVGESAEFPEAPKTKSAELAAAGAEASEAAEPLFSEIMHRLGVERIVSRMQSYGSYSVGERVSSVLELNSSEWVGMMNAVNLFDHRRDISVSAFSPVHRHYNAYETGLALKPDAEDDEVVGSVVAAAWINMAQNAFLSRIAGAAHTDVNISVDVSKVLPDAAARTLERFREWHTERGEKVYAESMFERSLQSLDRLEERVLAQLGGESGDFTAPARIMLEEGETEEARADMDGVEPETPDMAHYLDVFRSIRQERSSVEHLIELAKSAKGSDTIRQILERARTTETSESTFTETASIQYLMNELREVEERGEDAPVGRPITRNMNELISELIERSSGDVISLHPTEFEQAETIAQTYDLSEEAAAAEDERTSRENLKAELDEYDRRNKEIARELSKRTESIKRDEKKTPSVADVERRGAREALEGLSDSGKLLKDLREAAEEVRDGGTVSPELTLLLSSVAPEYKEIYERLLFDLPGAVKDEDSGIRAVNISDLNADISSVREHSETELRHLEREIHDDTEVLRERVERTIERVTPSSRAGRTRGDPHPYEPVRMHHRQQDDGALPDGVTAGRETADTARTSREVTVKNIAVQENVIETEVNRAVRELEAKSARDIEGVISKALSEQMQMIESRVYSGVERKLDLERARRGK
ncbi:MAG: hypothetical protein LBQ21_00670 [Clostridiales Family XIII bacterium]|jgi:hypothetical protein|nr:hypothetical protein [Clostridiales Family XIII bacterium]